MSALPKIGDRIRLTHMADDPNPIPDGAEGAVTSVREFKLDPAWAQISVNWDNGRRLMLAIPFDTFEVIS